MAADDPEKGVEDLKVDPTVSTTPSATALTPASPPEPTMLEVHAPQEPIHTWRSFFIHIATIAVGLLIAIAFEQTVEYFHHRQQRSQLQEQMREALSNDTRLVAYGLAKLNAFHAYLLELKTAIGARRQGQSTPGGPSDGDARNLVNLLNLPSLAPYDAAKENGTISLLSSRTIRLYNRLNFIRDRMMKTVDQYNDVLVELEAFKRRFDDSSTPLHLGDVGLVAHLAMLSATELAEYQALIAKLVVNVEFLTYRLRGFDAAARAILNGATDETQLLGAINQAFDSP